MWKKKMGGGNQRGVLKVSATQKWKLRREGNAVSLSNGQENLITKKGCSGRTLDPLHGQPRIKSQNRSFSVGKLRKRKKSWVGRFTNHGKEA